MGRAIFDPVAMQRYCAPGTARGWGARRLQKVLLIWDNLCVTSFYPGAQAW